MSTSESSSAKSNREFEIAAMADDLLGYTLTIAGKKQDHTPRFPRYSYDGYVSQMVEAATTILKDVILANESRSFDFREKFQNEAVSYCIYFNHLIRVAFSKGWISNIQNSRWQRLVTSIRWKVYAWQKSDKERFKRK